jgi:hypothetical protein
MIKDYPPHTFLVVPCLHLNHPNSSVKGFISTPTIPEIDAEDRKRGMGMEGVNSRRGHHKARAKSTIWSKKTFQSDAKMDWWNLFEKTKEVSSSGNGALPTTN